MAFVEATIRSLKCFNFWEGVQKSAKEVRLLLEAGADKDLLDKNGITALMLAAASGYVEVVRLLVKATNCLRTPNKNKNNILPYKGTRAIIIIIIIIIYYFFIIILLL